MRQREGKLTTVELAGLRQYLNQANNEKIKDDEFIIINYITSYPVIEPQETLSSWSILNKSFYNKAQKLAPGKMFYIYNQQQPNAIYSYKRKHIKWFSDKDNYVLKLLFPAEANYGNAAVIRQTVLL
ncbi:hypothetical protein [Flavobacterium psychrotrophum]|uniref:hypothetical protein n=1 Tax=Flavobacterium psychrotrophum TaxID=2294119 RepID=UPI0013C47F57|nr:hypothetical protein [Flavobacterium psychrotrophum]